MKKVILFLFLLLSVQTFAQITRTAVFDFSTPTSLNPSITPKSENAQTVLVTDKVFSNSGIHINFTPVGVVSPGARITTKVYNGNTTYYLQVGSITDMTFSVENGVTLDQIRFADETIFGGFYLKDNEKGTIKSYNTYRQWNANSSDQVNSVTFRNSDGDAQFYKIYVTYTEPSAVLSPTSSNIPQNGIVESLEKIELNFADNMSIYNSNGITLSNGTKTWNLTATVSGSTVTLTPAEEIKTDGFYTLSVPAKSFKNANGYENKALTYTIQVSTPKNTLNYESVNPLLGDVEKLESPIILTYGKNLAQFSSKLTMQKNGEDFSLVSLTRDPDNSEKVIISFDIPQGIKEKGVYTIEVPEATIEDNMGKTHNPTFTLKYEIGGTTPTPDPAPDPKPQDTEAMKLAKQLVATTGAGYPTATSASRSDLENLIKAETAPSDEELETAIEAFYKESDIQMPTAGTWYAIANLDSEGNKRYLKLNGNELTLTDNASEASAFEANGDVSFKTIDGKYLYTKGVRDEETLLTLKKFEMPSVKAKDIFGAFSFYGFLMKNALKKDINAYALVNCQTGMLETDVTIEDLQFDTDFSSAFILLETNKPDEEIKTVETAYTITPDIVEKGNDLTLTFTSLQNVTKADNFDAYIANAAGNRIETASVIASGTQTNQFTIALSGFDNGTYQIVLPKGSFLYQKDGKTVQTQLIQKSFTIGKGGSGDDGNFSYTYAEVIANPSNNGYIKDADLNNFTISIIKGDYSGLVADPNKTIRIAKYNNNETMATGHFETTEENPDYLTLKLVLDEPIVVGTFRAAKYAVVIERGTFGDANFGKYLEDKTSVNAASCRVNPTMNINYDVDNSQATSIQEITSDSNKETIIYDLMGRRVQSMSRPGIYIVNGKKVVKK